MPRKRSTAAPKPLYAARDTPADAAKRKREKRAEKRDFAYLEWLHTQPCVVCGGLTVEAHHQPYRSAAGWHDRLAVPLCPQHHRGAASVHLLGLAGFEAKHGISLTAHIVRLQEVYHETLRR